MNRMAPRILTAQRVATHGEWVTVAVTSNDPEHPAYELDMTAAQYIRTVLLIKDKGSAPIPTGENA